MVDVTLTPLNDLPAATLPLATTDLLLVQQAGVAKKVTTLAAGLPVGVIAAGLIFAGPATGAAAVPTFRSLVANDIPGTLNATSFLGVAAATDFTISGNSVLGFAQQGTVVAYGSLIISSGLTLTGNTLTSGGSGGTVTSVAETFTGGIVSVGGSPITGAGTLALTVAGTSGGAVFFSSASTWASSGLLTNHSLMVGGGAGAGPSTPIGLGTLGNTLSSSGTGDPAWAALNLAGGANYVTGQLPLGNIANIGTNTVLGNITGAPAAPTALTQTQLTALINTFSSSLSGAAPSSGGGTANFLRADGTWNPPPGSFGSIIAGGVLSGATITTSGTIGLTAGTGLSGTPGSGTIANAGVLSVDTAVGAILLGNGLQRTSQTVFVIPATTAALGGVIIGANLTVNAGGTISVGAPGTGTLTQIIAAGALSGGTITGTGTVGLAVSSGLTISAAGTIAVLAATTAALGGVIAGSGITINAGGTISVAAAGTTSFLTSSVGTPFTLSPGTISNGSTLTLAIAGGLATAVPYFASSTSLAVGAAMTGNSVMLASSTGPKTVAGLTTNGNSQLTIGAAAVATGQLKISGNTSGTAIITVQTAAGTPTVTLGTSSGTPAVSLPAPLTITVATGDAAWTGLTSGGVLFASSTTAVGSSALLTANAIVLGGGAGVAPSPLGSLGTTTTVLHGNAAGAPTFGAVSLTADVSGALPSVNGGSTQFGTGADGALTTSSGTTTLTHDAHYTNVTISGTGKINAAGFKIFVSGTLDLSAAGAQAIYNAAAAGNNASGATGGAGVASSQNGAVTSLWNNMTTSPAGGTGSTTTGTVGGSPNAGPSIAGGASPNGATGGAATSPGSAGGTATATAFGNGVLILTPVGHAYQATASRVIAGNSGAGGGCGGGDAINAGGGGGGGGQGGLHLFIAAQVIARGTNSTAGIIQAIGGLGGNGAAGVAGNTGGGAGGSGGGGGFVQITAGTLTGSTITNAIDVSGGTSGNGGNGVGTGLGGLIAAGGNGGGVMIAVLSPASITNTLVGNSVSGSAGTAPSGATGGTGGAGAVAKANL